MGFAHARVSRGRCRGGIRRTVSHAFAGRTGVRVPCAARGRRTRRPDRANHGVQGFLAGVGSGRSMQTRALVVLLTAIVAAGATPPAAPTPAFPTGSDPPG